MTSSVTFEQARSTVESFLRRDWPASQGTLYVAPYGFEDATHWHIIAGAYESLVEGDFNFDLMDAPALLVDKTTGGLTEAVVIDNFERLGAMTPVGNVPPD